MKKVIVWAVSAATVVLFSGCQMCVAPQDSSCVEPSHATNKAINPSGLAYTAPTVLPSTDQFIPHFKAGAVVSTKECVGAGTSVEEATNEAIDKFKAAYDCDYVVIVNLKIEKKTHPSWRIFKTSNYAVTISRGIPIKLDNLERVVPAPAKECKEAKKEAPVTKKEIAAIIKNEIAAVKNQNAGMIKLSDINVQINAKGVSTDKAAVIYPVK